VEVASINFEKIEILIKLTFSATGQLVTYNYDFYNHFLNRKVKIAKGYSLQFDFCILEKI